MIGEQPFLSVPGIPLGVQLETVEIGNRQRWRKWLEKHHTSSAGVWLVFYKKHTGTKALTYEDAVQEALCFGWIDSLAKRLDEARYAIKITPRKPTSNWSDLNRKRWAHLKAVGLLASAGLATAPTDNRYAPRPVVPILPAYIAKALRAHPKAWAFFNTLAPSYRRHYVVWIHTAKRQETREKRLRESIALLEAGKRLSLK
jgi:uncharacterized protein YdeI (YjbR/CyaY-like superfamily)